MTKRRGTYIQHRVLSKSSPEKVFAFFDRPSNVQRVTPKTVIIKTESHPFDLRPGETFTYRLKQWPVDLRWKAVVSEYCPPLSFTTVQSNGYFYMWNHSYQFLPKENATEIQASLEYETPPGLYARFSNHFVIRNAMEELVYEQVLAVVAAIALNE